MRFLLVDRIEEVEEGARARGWKNAAMSEDYFEWHFPERPVMPGVMIVEAMAQAGGFLLLHRVPEEDRAGKLILFTGIDNCRFRRPVIPGDQLMFEVNVVNVRSSFAKMHGRAMVDGELACEADLMSAAAER